MDTIQQYRQKNPQFNSVPDEALGNAVYEQHYADKMPRSEFDTKFGLSQRMGVAEDAARSTVTGMGEGFTSSAGMLGEGEGYMAQFGQWVGDQLGLKPLPPTATQVLAEQMGVDPGPRTLDQYRPSWVPDISAPTTASIEKAIGFDKVKHQPQTTAGEYGRTIGSFVGPTALTGLVKGGIKEGIKLGTKYGVIPAVTSETTGQVARKIAPEYEAIARVLGGVGGGSVMAILSRPTNAAAALKNALPEGVTNSDIMKADALVRQAQRQGTVLTWPEALHKATNGRVDITGLQRILEQTPGGGPVLGAAMADRPFQIEAAMGKTMDDLSAGGQRVQPEIAGADIQQAAEGSIRTINQAITKATDPLYKQAATDIIDLPTFDALSKDPLYKAALKAVRNDPFHSRAVLGLPDRAVGVQNEIKKYLGRQAETAAKDADKYATTTLTGLKRDVRDTAAAASPSYEQALAAQTDLRRRYLNPAESGPIGKMAKTEDIAAQGEALLAAKPVEGSEQGVREAVSMLAARNKDAALQLVRTHLRKVFDETTQNLIPGENQWGGAKFAAEIRGNSQQAKNLEAAIRALPDGDTRWEGLKTFLDVMEATGRRQRPGSLTAFNIPGREALGQGGVINETARTVQSLGRRLLDFHQERRLKFVSESLSKMILDPNSVGLLRNLAAAKTVKGRQALAGYLVAFYASQQGQKPPAPVEEQMQQNGGR